MRPFPTRLLDDYPTDSLHLRERPWWHTGRSVWTRSDGVSFSLCNPVNPASVFVPFPLPINMRIPHDLDNRAFAVWLDENLPVKHPGYRPGQVWAAANGDAVTVSTVVGGLRYEDLEYAHIIQVGKHPFLVYDPIRPLLAPWSPPNVP